MRILTTGGAGFTGPHLVDALLAPSSAARVDDIRVDAAQNLAADVAVLGECEEIPPRRVPARQDWADVPSVAYVDETGTFRVQGSPHASDISALPLLVWSKAYVRAHQHHHDRFDHAPSGPGSRWRCRADVRVTARPRPVCANGFTSRTIGWTSRSAGCANWV